MFARHDYIFFITAFLQKTERGRERKREKERDRNLSLNTILICRSALFLLFLRVAARIAITIFLTYHCHFVFREP